MAAMADALSTLGASFITFFPVANPIGSALIFDRVVVDLGRSARRRLATHIALLSGVIVFVAAVAGSDILHALGIRLDALRVAGGLILGAQAWRLIGHTADAGDRSDGRVAAPGALVPLTVPLTIGPGTIAAAISLGAAAAAGAARGPAARCAHCANTNCRNDRHTLPVMAGLVLACPGHPGLW